MSTLTKWIIGIAAGLITLLAIAAPIYYYVHDFHDLPRSSDPADWGTFGDYFGGILNPVISLLTLIITIIIAVNISKIEQRNHDETVHSPVKPLFTIDTGEFFSSNISRNGLTVERDFYDYDPPQQPAGPHDYLSKGFYLKVFNKGLGIATDVNVTFQLDLEALKSLVIINVPQIKVTASDLRTDEDGRKFIVLDIQSTHFNYHGFSKIWAWERYGLGPVDKAEEIEATVPGQIMSAFQLYNLVRKLRPGPVDDYPAIFVTFNFKNIHGKQLSTKFRVGLFHVHDHPQYSMFRILQQQI
ncbi:hypothetical protein SAMN04488505_102702 [Chitinophaga rupis]|uniref:Uncharacterized protein n=1 Tax=Chitinophaga rupis TaxID=573321 RepID=A0A1H7RQA4_9BACT|nr:hypothetical protein [Chitinophaga rupis]SEL62355.1 hypothetical protein SAMN04488505_102702 [Chitinophaga rupis]